MAYNLPLTVDQLTALRSESYAGDHYVTFMSNRVVFAGQIVTDLSVAQSWWYFTYNNVTVGSWDLAKPQQVLLIGQVNDITKATYRGRLRTQPNSAFVYSSESSFDYAPGAYFWVIDTYDITYRLSRPVKLGDDVNSIEELVDADLIYQTPYPVVKGLQMGYVLWADPDTDLCRLSLDVSDSYHWDPDRTVVSFGWAFYTGTYVIVSGDLDEPIIEVDLDQGEQWGELTLTDDIGQSWTRPFAIKAHGPDYLPNVNLDQLQISGDMDTPWTFSSTALAGEGISNLLDQTFTMVFRKDEVYGGESTSVAPNNIAFVGWIQKVSDDVQDGGDTSISSTSKFEFASVGARLARIYSQLLAFTLDSNPDEWGEIKSLTPWRGIIHFLQCYTTALFLSCIEFDGGASRDNTLLFPAITTQGGNALGVLRGIADQFNAQVEFTPDGNININRPYDYENDTVRGGIVPIATFTAEDIAVSATGGSGISRTVEPPSYGIIDADGAYYDYTTTELTVQTVRSPGHAQGSEPGRDTISNQILATTTDKLAALLELKLRAGCRYNILNYPEFLEVDMPDGYNFFTVSRRQIYLWDLDTSDLVPGDNVNRVHIDTSMMWMVESVGYNPGGNGTLGIHVRFRRLVEFGDPGDDTTPPIVDETADPVPDLGQPSFTYQWPEFTFPDLGLLPSQVSPAQLLPPPNQLVTTNGQYGVVKSDTAAYLLQNYITLITPDVMDITPTDLGDFLIKQILIDQAAVTSNAVPCYILACDGTNSAVWYSANVKSSSRVWTKGANVLGVFTILQISKGTGRIMMYCPTGVSTPTTWTKTFDYTSSADRTIPYNSLAIWEEGIGWEQRQDVDDTGLAVVIPLEFPAEITSVSATFTTDGAHTIGQYANIVSDTGVLAQDDTLAESPGGVLVATGLSQMVNIQISVNLFGGSGNWELTSITIAGNGENPFEYDWFRFDFRTGTHGWTPHIESSNPYAIYHSGQGWSQGNTGISLYLIVTSPETSDKYAYSRGSMEFSDLWAGGSPNAGFSNPVTNIAISPVQSGSGPDYDSDFDSIFLGNQIIAGGTPTSVLPGVYLQVVTLFTKRYWTKEFDFLTSDEGWVEDTHDSTTAQWVLSQGWIPGDISSSSQFNIKLLTIAPHTVIAMEVQYTAEGSNPSSGSYASGNDYFTDRIAELGPIVDAVHGTYIGSLTRSGMTEYHSGSQGADDVSAIEKLTVYGISSNPFVPDTGDVIAAYSTNKGSTFLRRIFGTGVAYGGFALNKSSGTSYAAADGEVYKSLTFGAGYLLFNFTVGRIAVAIDIPTHRMNSKTSKQTTSTSPDYIMALDGIDGDGGTLYFVEGISSGKNDITPVAGMTFDFPHCIASLYGTHIAVIGKVAGVYKLYITKNAGGDWTFISNITTPHFVTKRRNDNRPSLKPGFVGQLYLVAAAGGYSSKWGSLGVEARTIPSGVDGIDIIG